MVHLVCITEYRRGVFDAEALAWLQSHFGKVCATMGCELLACDGEAGYLHAIVEYPPKLSISVLVNALKGTFSRLLRKERPDVAARYWKGVLWSPSYFAASTGRTVPWFDQGGAFIEVVRRYVEQQRASSKP